MRIIAMGTFFNSVIMQTSVYSNSAKSQTIIFLDTGSVRNLSFFIIHKMPVICPLLFESISVRQSLIIVNYSPPVLSCGHTHTGYDHAYMDMHQAADTTHGADDTIHGTDDIPHGEGFKWPNNYNSHLSQKSDKMFQQMIPYTSRQHHSAADDIWPEIKEIQICGCCLG